MTRDKLPIHQTQFWRHRLASALEKGEIHRSIYDIDPKVWEHIQTTHQKVMAKLLSSTKCTRLLDGGCGYGALLDVLPKPVVDYTGVDLSPELVAEAQKRHPKYHFVVGNLCDLPYDAHSFDLAVCRSIDGMVKDHLGVTVWRQMESELLRVADRLILLNYTTPETYYILESTPDPEEYGRNVIETEGGRLIYRPGQGGSVELYDLFVEEAYRRNGVASKLVTQLLEATFGTVYAFTRADNVAAIGLYEKLGFSILSVPGFYWGSDARMAVKQHYPGDGTNARD